MASVDLLFSQSPSGGSPVNLVFGAGETSVPALVTAALEGTLPQPMLQARILAGPVTSATLAGVLPQPPLSALLDVRTIVRIALAGTLPQPELVAHLDAAYLSNTARPTVGESAALWQAAQHGEVGVKGTHQASAAAPTGANAHWQPALRLSGASVAAFQNANRLPRPTALRHQNGQRSAADAKDAYSDARRDVRKLLTSAFQNAEHAQTQVTRLLHQDGLRDRRLLTSDRWTPADPYVFGTASGQGRAKWLIRGFDPHHQNAMRPPAGIYTPGVTPGVDTCYVPSAHLLFDAQWSADANLVFICERHTPPQPGETIVVPRLGLYMITNDVSLRRLDNNLIIPALSFSLSLDVDSWTWTFGAEIPPWYFDDVQRISPDVPVELEATINGSSIRILAEDLKRERTFGSTTLRLNGRGLNAILDNPYSPIMNFGNPNARTIQQLAVDALTVNGVSNGWEVDWRPVDWSVPADTWAHQGTYASAINALAQAAGAYAQPHPTLNTLKILRRYPALPWEWAGVTPDYELPVEAVTVEGINWVSKPSYNRVFVSGEKGGVSVQATRTGSAGGMLAPQIVDGLITTVEAARAKAEAVLADTGDQLLIRLRMPVFPETGVILPGSFIRYVDGSTERLGLVRATGVEAAPEESWQTLEVESHA